MNIITPHEPKGLSLYFIVKGLKSVQCGTSRTVREGKLASGYNSNAIKQVYREGLSVFPNCTMNESTNLVWFATCFTNFSNNDISVNISIDFRVTLHSNKAMLLTVVKPVACATCSNDSLKLIGLHPNDLLYTLVTPKFQTKQAYNKRSM